MNAQSSHSHHQCLYGLLGAIHYAPAAAACATQAAGRLHVRFHSRRHLRCLTQPNSPSCSFSLSTRAWAIINAVLWVMVTATATIATTTTTSSVQPACISHLIGRSGQRSHAGFHVERRWAFVHRHRASCHHLRLAVRVQQHGKCMLPSLTRHSNVTAGCISTQVKFDRSIDSLEGGKYEFKKL